MKTSKQPSRRIQRFTLKPLAAIMLSMLALQGHAASSYTDLGSLGGSNSGVGSVSADGNTVVGNSMNSANHFEAYRWNGGVMTGLGFLGTGAYSFANWVSADGNTVAGHSTYDATGNAQAFRWFGGVMTGLGFLGTGKTSYTAGLSADGSTVVGYSTYDATGNNQAFRWFGSVMTGLGFLGTGKTSYTAGLSADGSTVVGYSNYDATGHTQAFRWFGGVMTGLGFLGSGNNSYSTGVSADGSTVVGSSNDDAMGSPQAFRWFGGVMTGLGFIGTGTDSYASSVSADGNTVAGSSTYYVGSEYQAFRWKDGVMTGLGFLGTGDRSYTTGLSADGTTVVGYSDYDASGKTQAFRWHSSTGMQSISQWLAAAGVTAPASLAINSEAYGVSADGSVVAGNSGDTAWLARVDPVLGGGFLPDLNAFNRSLMRATPNLPNLAMFGAHHRSILDNGLAKTNNDGACGWTTVDGGRHDNNRTSEQFAEVGACKDFGRTRIGVGFGQAWFQQDMSLSGSNRYDGQYLLAEVAKEFDNGLQPSITGYYGHFDAKMSRHYVNGVSVDNSSGDSNANGYALRARLDWKDAAQLGRFSLSPYAAYTWMKTQLDSYTESGGGFPAYFEASSSSTDDIRVGLAATTPLSPSTDLRLGGEVVHRIDENTSANKGQVIGLWRFSMPNQDASQNWVRATVDVDHRFTDKVAMTVGAISSDDATWGVTAGLRANF